MDRQYAPTLECRITLELIEKMEELGEELFSKIREINTDQWIEEMVKEVTTNIQLLRTIYENMDD